MVLSVACRLYIDESGDHRASHQTEIGKRYLGVVGVCFEKAAGEKFRKDLDDFKREHLDYDEDDPPILHREDIVSKRGSFHVLRDDHRRAGFDQGLLNLIKNAHFYAIAVVIDKWQHSKKTYRQLMHPYHYCLHAMLERYCGRLDFDGTQGDVIAESRGGVEDTLLKRTYGEVWEGGTLFCPRVKCKKTLTSKNLKLKPKGANVAGLQLADIVAHPLTRDVLHAHSMIPDRGGKHTDQMCEVLKNKYNRQLYSGRIHGYGRVLLS